MHPARHSDYYFEDGNLVILIENTLFNVHRSTFTRHSPLFRDLFSLPKPSNGDTEGSEDANPLFFEGIASNDFERLLWIMYPPVFGVFKPVSAEEWISVLHLSTRWEFADIRALAIQKLEAVEMSAIDKVVLSRQFDIQSAWTTAAYAELCERPQAITVPDALRLGLETSTKISQLREKLAKRSLGRTRPSSPSKRPSLKTSGLLDHHAHSSGRNTGEKPAAAPSKASLPRMRSDTTRMVLDMFGTNVSHCC